MARFDSLSTTGVYELFFVADMTQLLLLLTIKENRKAEEALGANRN